MRQKLNWFFPKISRLVLVAVIALTGVGYAAMIPFGFFFSVDLPEAPCTY